MAGLDILLHRRPPTAWDNFKSSPLLFLAQQTYAWTAPSTPTTLSPAKETIRVVCISDTHNTHHSQPPLPAGDILVHSGDLTQSGTLNELCDALDWLNSQPHPLKIFIAGNHDSSLADPKTRTHIVKTYPALIYLENSSTELTVRGRVLRVYGSPYTPKHGSWAFQYPRVSPASYSPHAHPYAEHESTSIWTSIPPLTDILITHGPPSSHLDLGRTGCYALLCALWRVRPQLHVFGHIHAARGVEHITWGRVQRVYEDVCAEKSGWGGLTKLVWWAVVGKVRLWLWGGDNLQERERTTLVNAAAVGGMKDDQRRGAIVVEI
ncbi:metallophosphoesterase domain-containing protein 1 [Hygrophoropsis aurantiaca]|uniref:Metallophosphoesterase domain-containing protein 1 n=1 Tax=Hygrophoropsis aurantiaca TaxID=72124 RepID=A0ACB7ZWS7_9AGAM|nr:metallophosphoesterase domain-containing protein 1 [Hygrophoropsis aurantiaca]